MEQQRERCAETTRARASEGALRRTLELARRKAAEQPSQRVVLADQVAAIDRVRAPRPRERCTQRVASRAVQRAAAEAHRQVCSTGRARALHVDARSDRARGRSRGFSAALRSGAVHRAGSETGQFSQRLVGDVTAELIEQRVTSTANPEPIARQLGDFGEAVHSTSTQVRPLLGVQFCPIRHAPMPSKSTQRIVLHWSSFAHDRREKAESSGPADDERTGEQRRAFGAGLSAKLLAGRGASPTFRHTHKTRGG